MKCLCNVQSRKTASIPQHAFPEDQFFEQFAALEEVISLVQIQLRDLSENARLFDSLVSAAIDLPCDALAKIRRAHRATPGGAKLGKPSERNNPVTEKEA